jgi:hypothetical protein
MTVLLRRRGCSTHIVEMVRKYKMENEFLNENGLIFFNIVKTPSTHFLFVLLKQHVSTLKGHHHAKYLLKHMNGYTG